MSESVWSNPNMVPALIHLRCFERLTYERIADILGVSKNTIVWKAHKLKLPGQPRTRIQTDSIAKNLLDMKIGGEIILQISQKSFFNKASTAIRKGYKFTTSTADEGLFVKRIG